MGKFIDRELFDWQRTVVNENKRFNLEEFMKNKYDTSAAVVLITPLQAIMCKCSMGGNYQEWLHTDVLQAMYSAVYEEEVEIKEASAFKDLFKNDNNIRMLLCSGISTNIIYLPEVIDINQYNCLNEFNNMIKDIYDNNKAYFDKYSMFFGYISSGDDDFSEEVDINNIDSILELAKERIGSFSYSDEYRIGNDIRHDVMVKTRKKY